MNLNEVKTLTEEKMFIHALTSKGWKFHWSRAKQCFGRCDHRRKLIKISKPLSLINEREAVLDTILHEIAHALVGPRHGHDHVWKAKCREIGARPTRCFTSKDTNCIERPKLESVTIDGVVYTEGSPIILETRNGIETCTFIKYMPRNHKYPIIAKTPSGKRFKFPKYSIKYSINNKKVTR